MGTSSYDYLEAVPGGDVASQRNGYMSISTHKAYGGNRK